METPSWRKPVGMLGILGYALVWAVGVGAAEGQLGRVGQSQSELVELAADAALDVQPRQPGRRVDAVARRLKSFCSF